MSDSDRDASGRFTKGNAGGPGNPHARQVAKLRSMLLDEALRDVDGDGRSRLQRVASKLFDLAEDGDVQAARLCLEYSAGKPRPHDDREDDRSDTFVFVLPESVSDYARRRTPNLAAQNDTRPRLLE